MRGRKTNLLGLSLWLAATSLQARNSARDCVDSFQDDQAVAMCLYGVYYKGNKDGATRILEEQIERHPSSGWLHFVRGNMADRSARKKYYEKALQLFREHRDYSGQIRVLGRIAVFPEGFKETYKVGALRLKEAREILEDQGLGRLDQADLLMYEARHSALQGDDLDSAHSKLNRAWQLMEEDPAADYPSKRECLRTLTEISLGLQLNDAAENLAWQAVELTRQEGDPSEEASALYDHARVLRAVQAPNHLTRPKVVHRLEDALRLAVETGGITTEIYIRQMQVQMLAQRQDVDPAQVETHLERICTLATPEVVGFERLPKFQEICLLAQAHYRLKTDRNEARRLLEDVYQVRSQFKEIWELLDSWGTYLPLVWGTQPLERALAESEAILDTIEDLRRSQIGDARQRLLSAWADAYYWVAGRLLKDGTQGDNLRRAFAFFDRLRAQALREAIELGRPSAQELPEALSGQLKTLKEEQIRVHRRRLLNLASNGEEDKQVLDRLDQLDRKEAELRSQMAPYRQSVPALPEIPDDLLDRLEDSLDPDEALLSYQIGHWEGYDGGFAGGSWVVAVTSVGSRAYPLVAGRAKLETVVKLYFGQEDYGNPEYVARLYFQLLKPVIDDLPTSVRRLILVPDGLVHRVPFALLRPSDQQPPLIERFELAVAPSAYLWLHWRERGQHSPSAGSAALALANPAFWSSLTTDPPRDEGLIRNSKLGPLPFAEMEGRRVIDHFGGGSLMASGKAASESYLKGLDLEMYRIVHFAAHAVVPGQPWRSAVLLAAGEHPEDGLLHPAEIGRLNLAGKMVVLATCKSATGEVLRGEGVLSLSRAFFEAGAHAVVGSLWPLDDWHALQFFDAFYGRLSRGLSVGQALTETQREWIENGEPPHSWAGIVALGNSDLIPAPNGIPKPYLSPSGGIIFLLFMTLAALLWRLWLAWRSFPPHRLYDLRESDR